MKKYWVILLAFLLIFTLSGCKGTEPETSSVEQRILSNIPKPEQDILFLITSSSYSEGSSARFIDNEGNFYKLPDGLANIHETMKNSGWYEKLIAAKENAAPIRKVEEPQLNVMYEFVNCLDTYIDFSLKSYDHTIYDYGGRSLYLLYKLPDGTADIKTLCTYGGSTQCADNDKVRDFVNWMVDNSYFIIYDKNFDY